MTNLPKAAELIGSTVTQQQFKTKLKQLIENIDRSYSTLAEANADIAYIALDTKVTVLSATDGGLWYKATAGATSLTKSPYDTFGLSKAFTNEVVSNLKDSLGYEVLLNLYNPANDQIDKRVTGTGAINPMIGAKCTEYIPVVPGQDYTISCRLGDVRPISSSFYAENKNHIIRHSASPNPQTLIAPENAAFLVVNVKYENQDEPRDLQIELGSIATTYKPFKLGYRISKDSLPDDVATIERVKEVIESDYDEFYISKNLFDESAVQQNKYLSSTPESLGALITAEGWAVSDLIPVKPNTTYTLSFDSKARQGLSVFGAGTSKSLLYDATTTSPLTIVTPPGAQFLVFALETSAAKGWKNVQLEEGDKATTCFPYGARVGRIVKQRIIGLNDDLLNINEQLAQVPTIAENAARKDYEENIISKNLFDESLIRDGIYINNSGGLGSAPGWKTSGLIPIKPNTSYTLSFKSRGRQGLTVFNSAGPGPYGADTNTVLYDATATSPLTIVTPQDSAFIMFNLESEPSPGWSEVQLEEGEEATAYFPSSFRETLVSKSRVNGLDGELNSINARLSELSVNTKAKLSLANGIGFIESGKFKIDVKVVNPVVYTRSAVFNFNTDYYQDQPIRLNGDDSAPVRMMGATIGANHGYSKTDLTAAGHGKTNDDIGSVWTDTVNEWVIIQIISTNVLAVTCRTANISYSSKRLTMTHVSGGSNTGQVTVTAVNAKQWYPMLKNHIIKASVDGMDVGINANLGFKDNFKVSESYDLMEKSDIVEWVILNGGKELTSYQAESALNVSNVHRFSDDLTDVISCNFFTYKQLSAAKDVMFTQSGRMTPVKGELLYYVPRSVSFMHEAVNYDFSKPSNVANLTITNRINFDLEKTEPGAVLPDRLIMLGGSVGYAVGYLPILDASPDVRNSLTSKGVQISNSAAKVYPYLVDSLTTLAAGVNYSAVAYRAYFERPEDTRRTSHYDVPHGSEAYLFIDWHIGGFIDNVELKPYLQGRSFEVVEKTENVTLLSKVATNSISVNIGEVSSNARLILKFK